jgi:hypothetical protein
MAGVTMSFCQRDPVPTAQNIAHDLVPCGLLPDISVLPELLLTPVSPYAPSAVVVAEQCGRLDEFYAGLSEAVASVTGAVCKHFQVTCPPLELKDFPKLERPIKSERVACPSLELADSPRIEGHLEPEAPGRASQPVPAEPPIKLQGMGLPILVLGKKKDRVGDQAYRVLAKMAEAYPKGVKKDVLEAIASDARGILSRLAKDKDWARVILMPRRSHLGYRLVYPPA